MCIRDRDSYFTSRMDKTWNGLVSYVQANPVLVVLKTIYEALRPWQQYSDDFEKQRFYKSNYELLIEKIIKAYSCLLYTSKYLNGEIYSNNDPTISLFGDKKKVDRGYEASFVGVSNIGEIKARSIERCV